MSVVIAIKENNHIVLGCDSQVSTYNCKSKLSKENTKIWSVKNCDGALMGSVGLLRITQLIQVQDNLIDELTVLKNGINFQYCVTTLFDKICEILQKYNLLKKQEGTIIPDVYNEFIFAYKDKAWLIYSDGSVEEIEDYLVIGSGEEIAKGVLESNKSKCAKMRIKQAIKSCSDMTLYVDDNIVIKTTKGEVKNEI